MTDLTPFDTRCLQLAIDLAQESRRRGGPPFGAVLARNNKIKAQSYDRRTGHTDPTAHAEMCVIREHCWQQGLRHLKGYTIYCSTEPCVMCSGAIRSSKINRVVFSLSQQKLQQISGGISKGGCKTILATSREPVEIIGPVLPDMGATVFDGYAFPDTIPAQDTASSATGSGGRSFGAHFLDWSRRLRAIGRNGVLYAETVYHRERYEAVIRIAEDMLAAAGMSDSGDQQRQGLIPNDYETPKIDVRAVVSRADKLLFVREADDRLWSLPGGWVEIGETPRESIEKEVLDESGFRVRVTQLLGVFDKDRHGAEPRAVAQVITFFFACEILDPQARRLDSETTEYRFCGAHEIPELSPGRVPLDLVQRMYGLTEGSHHPTQFD